MAKELKRVIFAGGGTGGHLYPAVAIGTYLRKNYGVQIAFVGNRHSFEERKLSELGEKFFAIRSVALKRGKILVNLPFTLPTDVQYLAEFARYSQFSTAGSRWHWGVRFGATNARCVFTAHSICFAGTKQLSGHNDPAAKSFCPLYFYRIRGGKAIFTTIEMHPHGKSGSHGICQ
jgi:hypothetical protein